MRTIASALLAAALTLGSLCGVATAEPARDTSDFALVSLTTIPGGWTMRTDLRPQLEVDADGSALHRPDVLSTDRAADTAPREVRGTVPAEDLDKALDRIRALRETDFGVPAVTDHGIQIIDLMPENPSEDVHLVLYAPDVTDGLSDEQRDARKKFAEVFDSLMDAFEENS
ncbi:hypothetical protein [Nocardia higoensis]|uniref:hypothetical protein n=1 Tax=Nocardia higoensis TaxID=228599 RepID=UPI00031B5A40|nr:hypothetical protein [Nocardia higoensis]